MTSPVIFGTYLNICRTNQVILRTNQVIFRTNPVIFRIIRSYLGMYQILSVYLFFFFFTVTQYLNQIIETQPPRPSLPPLIPRVKNPCQKCFHPHPTLSFLFTLSYFVTKCYVEKLSKKLCLLTRSQMDLIPHFLGNTFFNEIMSPECFYLGHTQQEHTLMLVIWKHAGIY